MQSTTSSGEEEMSTHLSLKNQEVGNSRENGVSVGGTHGHFRQMGQE